MNKKRDRSSTTLDTMASQSSHENEIDEHSENFENGVKAQRKGSITKIQSVPQFFNPLGYTGPINDSDNVNHFPLIINEENADISRNDHRDVEQKNIGEASKDLSRVSSLPSMHLASEVPCPTEQIAFEGLNPVDFMKAIISSNGFDSTPISSLQVHEYFEPVTAEQVASYDMEITNAVRKENLDALRAMQATGRNMHCCNRFGESIVHMACRRGSLPIVSFLTDECDSTIRLRDDYGRTPLHDACWTSKVEFRIIRLLLSKEPDLILMSDKRGHTPLDYIRKDSWEEWCHFLDEHRYLLTPRMQHRKN